MAKLETTQRSVNVGKSLLEKRTKKVEGRGERVG